MMLRSCGVCNEVQANEEFHADNKTGWSKVCKTCRKKMNQRNYTRSYRNNINHTKEIQKSNEAHAADILARKINDLQKEFKRFTLPNRTRINQLEKHLAVENPSRKTVNAYNARKKQLLEAEEILSGQIELVNEGLFPLPIEEIWRMNHGEHARSESKEENQTDIGCTSDISLLTVYGGDG